MATPVIMPKFGMAQEEGTVIRWLKQEGDRVEKGDVLLEVMTDKVDMEVEAQASGILQGIRVGPGETVPVTTVLAYILEPGEALPQDAAPTQAESQAEPQAAAATEATEVSAVKASPVARRMAAEQGIDLARLTGSGPGGRVTKEDVLAAVQAAQASPPPGRVRATPAARRLAREAGVSLDGIPGSGPRGRIQAADVERRLAAQVPAPAPAQEPVPGPVGATTALPDQAAPLTGMRRTIARRLTQSWQTIPHVTFTASVDMRQAEALRQRLAPDVEAAGGRFTPTVLLALAVARLLPRHPRLNAWLQPQGDELLLTQHSRVNLGVAVALDEGLIVPVIHGAEELGLAALARRIGDLSQRARSGDLQPQEVMDGTFTISNLGMFPVDHFTALINPPQVAILAVGRAQMQPVWDGEGFQPAPVLRLTLSADHRAVDGAVAAAFLADLKAALEDPARLLL